MQLTLTGEYAIRAMIYIAGKPFGTNFTIGEIASQNKIPDKFLRKILPQLCTNGLLISQRGKGGGVKLKITPEKITPLKIVQAIEGDMALNKCIIDNDFCSDSRWCSMHVLWAEAQKNLKNILNSKSIAELAKSSEERRINSGSVN
jgi:Rrf2 family iron-sulfur cluster assembly transcriptional regulator